MTIFRCVQKITSEEIREAIHVLKENEIKGDIYLPISVEHLEESGDKSETKESAN